MLLFLIVLAGAFDRSPLNQFYWLEADTSGIQGAPDQTRWTNYGYCGVQNGKNYNCSSNKPDFAFQPDKTFGTTQGVPQDFIENHDTYYYLSRFSWPFYLIALFFLVVGFLLNFFAICSRLGSALSSLSTFVAWLFTITASCLSTALYVMARNKFDSAKLGVKLFAFTWTATALLTLTFIFLTCGCCTGGSRKSDPYDNEKSSFRGASSRSNSRRGFFSVRNNREADYAGSEAYAADTQGGAVQPVSSYERGA